MPTFLGKISDELIEGAAAADMAVCTEDASVPVGMCLMFVNGKLFYKGPINGSPPPYIGGVTVMNPADLQSFAEYCDKKKH